METILSAGLATEVVGLVSAGKETNVYLARYNGAPLAIKAYRLYRTSHRGGRPVKVDTMSWLAAHEFEMMRQAWKGGVRVPTPARRVLSGILTGVERLVSAGVVHADLSAFNILVYEESPWFIGFSCALRVDRSGTAPLRRLIEAEMYLSRGLRALQTYSRRYELSLPIPALVNELIHRIDRFSVLE